MASHIKCPECGVFNTNKEICTNCGAILSYEKRREIDFKKEEQARKERARLAREKNPSFFEKYKDHRYWIVRTAARVTRSMVIAFLAIGTLIAWIVTAIAA